MPPKQRCAAAGGGQQAQKPTGKQELREQGRETGPSPPHATSEMKSSKLRSEFERVMAELKFSCPSVIELGTDVLWKTPDNMKLSLEDVSRLAQELSKHSGLQEIDLSGTCVAILC
jgi:hypothetical protein